MGFVRIFWKNNAQESNLPKMSISGQIVSEIVAQLYLEHSIQTLLIFFLGGGGGVDPSLSNKFPTIFWRCIFHTLLPKLP